MNFRGISAKVRGKNLKTRGINPQACGIPAQIRGIPFVAQSKMTQLRIKKSTAQAEAPLRSSVKGKDDKENRNNG